MIWPAKFHDDPMRNLRRVHNAPLWLELPSFMIIELEAFVVNTMLLYDLTWKVSWWSNEKPPLCTQCSFITWPAKFHDDSMRNLSRVHTVPLWLDLPSFMMIYWETSVVYLFCLILWPSFNMKTRPLQINHFETIRAYPVKKYSLFKYIYVNIERNTFRRTSANVCITPTYFKQHIKWKNITK